MIDYIAIIVYMLFLPFSASIICSIAGLKYPHLEVHKSMLIGTVLGSILMTITYLLAQILKTLLLL